MTELPSGPAQLRLARATRKLLEAPPQFRPARAWSVGLLSPGHFLTAVDEPMTYHGSCHCGAVQFRCELDLASGTSRCNCSMCWKGRFWNAIVPARSFELLAGEELLAEYRFGTRSIRHRFCRHCGIKPYGEGELAAMGGRFYAVNLACLDDIPLEELLGAPIAHENGRHEQWADAPDEAPVL